ncbi:MAG: ceramidase domain-containing protein [Polyangiaceae bacterium]|nr:ceramidase domain-containing protein [Polyangiaceae bacterium]
MPRPIALPLPAECPWGGLRPPNVDWCEENLCSWIVNPADTWSNLALIALGISIVHHSRSSSAPGPVAFGPATILLGLISFAYHASYNYNLQLVDFFGNFVWCSVVIVAHAVRLGWVSQANEKRAAVGLITASSLIGGVLIVVNLPIQLLIGMMILTVVLLEPVFRYSKRAGKRSTRLDNYLISLGFLAVGVAGIAIDVKRIGCDPSNHWLQGHSVWHISGALAAWWIYHAFASQPGVPPPPASATGDA